MLYGTSEDARFFVHAGAAVNPHLLFRYFPPGTVSLPQRLLLRRLELCLF